MEVYSVYFFISVKQCFFVITDKNYLIYFVVALLFLAGLSISLIYSSYNSQRVIERPQVQNSRDITFVRHAPGGGGCVSNEEEGVVCRGDEIEIGPLEMRSQVEIVVEIRFVVTNPEGDDFICTANEDCEGHLYELDRISAGSGETYDLDNVVIGEELEHYTFMASAERSFRIPDESVPGTYNMELGIYNEDGEMEGFYEDDFEIYDEEAEEELEVPEDAETHKITVDMPEGAKAQVFGLVNGDETVEEEGKFIGEVVEGETVEITPETRQGYKFLLWLSEGVCDKLRDTDNTCEIEMENDEKVVGVFLPVPEGEESTLLIDVFEGGTISVDNEEIVGEAYGEKLVFDQGEEVKLEAEPEEGFEFQGWIGDMRSMEEEISVVIDDDLSISADFARIEHEIDFSIEGEGSVVPGEHRRYVHGDEVVISAVPSAGFSFKAWGGDIISEDQTISFEITEDMEIDAVFDRTGYVLEIIHTGDGNGRTTPEEGKHVFEEGETVDIRISAVEDTHMFEGFEGDVDCDGIECTVDIGYEDIEAKVRFEDGGSKVDLDKEGESCDNYEDGTPVKRSGHIHGRYCYDNVARYCPEEVTGIGDDPSLCEEEDDGKKSIYGCVDMDIDDKFCGTCGNECPEGYVCEDRQCTPGESLFEVDIDIEYGGSVMLRDTMFSVGEHIEIKANPLKGFKFGGWEGDVEKPEEPINVIEMDGDIELKPKFEEDIRTVKVYGFSDDTEEPGEVEWSSPEEFSDSIGEKPVEKEIQIGEEVRMIFHPYDDYQIESVRGNICEGVSRVCNFEVSEDMGEIYIIVDFEKKVHDIDDFMDSYEIDIIHEGEGKTSIFTYDGREYKETVFEGVDDSWSINVYEEWRFYLRAHPRYPVEKLVVNGVERDLKGMPYFIPKPDSEIKVVFED